jgi:hypothetical protein
MNHRKLKVGDRVLATPNRYLGTVVRVGKPEGPRGLYTPVYVGLDFNGQQTMVRAQSIFRTIQTDPLPTVSEVLAIWPRTWFVA